MKMKKILAMLLAVLMIVTATVAGTVAWLMDEDDAVTNTFSPSTIGVELKEHTYDAEKDELTTTVTDDGVTNYKMIPGWTIPKDPKAWITENSVDAYLFVKVVESDNFDSFMTYEIAPGWVYLPDYTGKETEYVIYREVAAGVTANAMDNANAFQILTNDQVSVRDDVTKDMMDALTDETKPTLTFTAYAHQLYSTNGTKFNPAGAWTNLNPNT